MITDTLRDLLKDSQYQLTPIEVMHRIISDDSTPDALKEVLQEGAMKVLAIDLPKDLEYRKMGPVIYRDDMDTVAEVFEGAITMARQSEPEFLSQISATVIHAGETIATEVDSAMRRVLLQDKYVNTEAYLNVLALHAELVSALENLVLTPDQQAWAEKADAEGRIKKAGDESESA